MPWFSPKDLKSTDLIDSIDHLSQAALTKNVVTLFPENSVAIVVRGMILAHSFPVAVLSIPATINQDMKILSPKSEMDPQFLAYAMRAQTSRVLSEVSTAGHGTKRLDSEALSTIQIPTVEPSVQRKFGLRVNGINRLKATEVKALSKLDELFASLQHRAFRGEL